MCLQVCAYKYARRWVDIPKHELDNILRLFLCYGSTITSRKRKQMQPNVLQDSGEPGIYIFAIHW